MHYQVKCDFIDKLFFRNRIYKMHLSYHKCKIRGLVITVSNMNNGKEMRNAKNTAQNDDFQIWGFQKYGNSSSSNVGSVNLGHDVKRVLIAIDSPYKFASRPQFVQPEPGNCFFLQK